MNVDVLTEIVIARPEGYELDPESRITREEIQQVLHFRPGGEGRSVEGEIALDQLDQLRTIFRFGRTDDHRASLASE